MNSNPVTGGYGYAKGICVLYNGYTMWWGSNVKQEVSVGYDMQTGRQIQSGATYNCPDLNVFVDYTMFGNDWPEGLKGREACHLTGCMLGLIGHLKKPPYKNKYEEAKAKQMRMCGRGEWDKQLLYMVDGNLYNDTNLGWDYSDYVREKVRVLLPVAIKYGIEDFCFGRYVVLAMNKKFNF